MERVAIGIDIGGTKILGALVEESGLILHKIHIPSGGAEGARAVLKNLGNTVAELLNVASSQNISIMGIGIGTGGVISPYGGKVLFATAAIPEWAGTELKKEVERSFGLETLVEGDGNTAALGEKRYGAGVSVNDLVCVTVGTGIGGGIIKGGYLLKGVSGCTGLIGHISIDANGPLCSCGNRGCVETYASGTAIAEMARIMMERGGQSMIAMLSAERGEEISAKLVGEAAQAGDELAQSIIKTAGEHIGLALVSVVNLLNPQLIVIGGGVSELGEMLIGPIKDVVKRKALPPAAEIVEIVQSSLGGDATVIGAASVVWEGS